MQHGIPHFDAPPKSLRSWRLPTALCDYSFGVVVSFGYFIPQPLLDCFSAGILNVHPSLLPEYRGAAPIIHALADGATKSGISIIELDPHAFDAGRLLAQVEVVSSSLLPLFGL